MLIIELLKVIALFIAVATVIILTMMAVWWVVYHIARCRKNPIGKTFVIGCAVLYLASAALLAAL